MAIPTKKGMDPHKGVSNPSKGAPPLPPIPTQHQTLPPNFYREGFRRLMKLSLLLILVIAGLIGYIFFQRFTYPKQEYFITTSNGQIHPIQPTLKKPNLSYNTVIQWASKAATAAYTLNFFTLDQEIEKLRPYFTPDGFTNFKNALTLSGKTKQIKEKKLIVSSVRTGYPVLLKENQSDNANEAQSWQVQLPMLVTYQSASDRTQVHVTITMLLTEVDTTENPKGIGIEQFIETTGST